MRAVEIALLIISIQIATGIISSTGIFGNISYDRTLINTDPQENISALSALEQSQGVVKTLNTIINSFTWGWIKNYFQPYYNQDAGLKNFIDTIVFLMRGVSAIVLGSAFIEIIVNRSDVLGG